MSILDDAIRQHLELKRAHGADEAELKRLEDEAFGPPGRPDEPDALGEAPTQFMVTEAPEAGEAAEEGRRINIADLQEPPPPEPAEDAAQAAPPVEEPPAMEHEVPAAPEAEKAPADHPAIAEQPTELFDVEAEMGTEDAPAAEAPSPSDEEIIEAEREEPRLVPVADEEEEDEEFWSEQRLSDELDQALESPLTEEHATPPPSLERDAEQAADPAAVYEDADPEDAEDEPPRADYDPDTGHEDVLEDTPEFLEDAPEDDELWFEQKPPKDFDFDD
jgi:hypothetical protein